CRMDPSRSVAQDLRKRARVSRYHERNVGMFTREQYLNSVRSEVQVIKHLHSKVPQEKLDYRPTPKQRSLQELLNALPSNLALAKHVITGDWSTVQQTMSETQEAAQKNFVGT